MGALEMGDSTVELDLDRCIGCGLCVTACPTGSMTLLRRPDCDQRAVPRNAVEEYIRLGQARGKLGYGEMLSMLVKSGVDRLLAAR
jgi:Fe-S-cluster-containing hydrogenase component 2